MIMSEIVIFTTYLDQDTGLFGEGDKVRSNRQPVANDKLAEIQNKIFALDSNKRDVWNNLGDAKKLEAFSDVEDPRVREAFVKRANDNDKDLKDVWEKKKLFIIQNSKGPWSVYKSQTVENVYALLPLSTSRELAVWVKDLVRLSKALNSDADKVYLILHDKDIKDYPETRFYVYNDEKLKAVFGGEENFKKYKKDYKIKVLNVALFQHNTQESKRLLNAQDLSIVDIEFKEQDKEQEKFWGRFKKALKLAVEISGMRINRRNK